RRIVLAAALTAGGGLLVLLGALANGPALLRTIAGIHPLMLVVLALLTLASYAAMSRSYQGIAEAAGLRLGFPTWLRITFVSNTANYLVTSAGLSGFAVRMYLLSQQRIPTGRAVLISLVQTFLTNFTLLSSTARIGCSRPRRGSCSTGRSPSPSCGPRSAPSATPSPRASW